MDYCANCNKIIYGNRTFCDRECEEEYDSFIDRIAHPSRHNKSKNAKKAKIREK